MLGTRKPSVDARLRGVSLALALLLALTGVTSLALHPSGAAAEELEPVPADFTVGAGETKKRTFSKFMVGSAEARPTPDGCRHDAAMQFTCSTHRIKLAKLLPGYFLRISTSWTARDAAGNSVPDVDTYLFDGPGSQFDYDEVGGVSGAVPETIKLVAPVQSEYDLVIGTYAGAISEYTVVVEYTDASSSPTAGILPDFVLTPDAPTIVRTFANPLAVPTIGGQAPDTCRNDPAQALVCDAFRIKVNRNKSKDATNFVVITLDWDVRTTPDLDLVALGLGGEQVPNLDMYVFDTPAHVLEGTGGNLFLFPERAGFVATQDEYDLTVQSKRGAGTGYTLSMFMTDELFDKPFEFLDPTTGELLQRDPDGSIAPVADRSNDVAPNIPDLGLAPIDIDSQIAGIGLGTTEQFDRAEAIRLGQSALRNVSVTSKPPALWVLWLSMVVVPLGLFVAFVVVMRRRHHQIV